jgi:PAS domain S-box-containing protein
MHEETYEALQAENERLRRRVAELERMLAGPPLSDDRASALEKRVPYQALFEHLPVPLVVYQTDGLAVAINRQNRELISVTREAIVGRHNIREDPQAIEMDYVSYFERAAGGETVKMPATSYDTAKAGFDRLEDRQFVSETSYFPIEDAEGNRYIVEINLDVTEQARAERQLRKNTQLLRAILDNAPTLIFARDLQGRYIVMNREAQNVLKLEWEDVEGRTDGELFPKNIAGEYADNDQTVISTKQPCEREEVFVLDGVPRFFITTRFPIMDISGEIYAVGAIATDITQYKETEAEKGKLQQEVIHVQEMTLRALSTPLIPIADRVVVMPLIGTVDRDRAGRVVETLLRGIQTHQAAIAILDVTGVPVVDSEVANALIQAANAVKLLGAEVVLTGIRPEIARTLIELEVDLSGIVTRGTLQSGIAYALGYRDSRITLRGRA